jgi:cyclic beta-1,2-glucan synthetase
VHDADIDAISYETDRSAFIGRGRSPARPAAMTGAGPLSNSQGPVLDPVVAIRCAITLAPGQVAAIDMVTGIAFSRADGAGLIEKYRDRRLADRVFDLAWTHSQVVRRQINASQADAQLYERLAGLVVHAHPLLRAPPGVLLQNRRGQSGLWGQAISGDHPIVLVRIADVGNLDLVRQMVQAHAYWRLKGLVVDMVVWNEDQGGYRQELQDQILGLVAAGVEAQVIDRPGGIFVRAAQHLPQEDRILLQSVARVIIDDGAGSLADQVGRRPPAQLPAPAFAARPIQYPLLAEALPDAADPADADQPEPVDRWPFADPVLPLQLGNGTGAFSGDGREYVIDLAPGATTPAPWANVLANARFGTVVSESAPGYTWAENAHAFRLTPWANDPVGDSGGEAFHLRDEETGRSWSPMPLPCPGDGAYRTRHGFGYSVFEHEHDGIASELWIYVDVDAPVKYCVLRLHNRSGRARALSAFGYVEWVLGDLQGRTRMHVVTEVDGDSQVLTARNPYNTAFEHRVAFFDVDPAAAAAPGRSHTGDRLEFLGRNGSLQQPAALRQERLSGRTGAGLDPCAALQVPIELEAGARSETVFRLGMGASWGEAVELAVRGPRQPGRPRRPGRRAQPLAGDPGRHPGADPGAGGRRAGQRLAAVPDHRLPVPGPQRLLPVRRRDRLPRPAAGQHGDAARPARRGARAPAGLRRAPVPRRRRAALVAPAVRPRRAHPLLGRFPVAAVRHRALPGGDRRCRRAARAGRLHRGPAGAPGRGVLLRPAAALEPANEDLYRPLQAFAAAWHAPARRARPAADGHGRLERRHEPCRGTRPRRKRVARLLPVRNAGALRRAGTRHATTMASPKPVARTQASAAPEASKPMPGTATGTGVPGSTTARRWARQGSDECNIDSIAQSWSVLSGAGAPERAHGRAMASLHSAWCGADAGLIQLLDPPFDNTAQDPGYIRGYLPGVRENGGQYTHAAIWATMAFAKLGDTATAWQLLDLINPVNHGATPPAIATYKVEPYVVAADVYAVAAARGPRRLELVHRLGGWMYRLIVESLLGLQREGEVLRIEPCLPVDWPGYGIQYRYGESIYLVQVTRIAGGPAALQLDGVPRPDLAIPLVDDHRVHHVALAWPVPPRD